MNKVLLCLIFIVFDFVTGIIKSIKNKNLNSSLMRTGLFRKSAEIFILLFGFLLDKFVDLYSLDLPPIFSFITIYVIMMEVCSIYENLCQLNSNLKNKKFSSFLDKLKKEGEQ